MSICRRCSNWGVSSYVDYLSYFKRMCAICIQHKFTITKDAQNRFTVRLNIENLSHTVATSCTNIVPGYMQDVSKTTY